MSTVFLTVKLLHIFLAIAALGANLTYGVWFARANQHPQFAPFALRGVKFIDDRIANPAYILLLPTGAAMVWLGGYSFGTHWIAWAMTLWLVAILVAYLGYTPTLTRQIEAVERDGIASPAATALKKPSIVYTVVLAVLIFAILVLMVFKPA